MHLSYEELFPHQNFSHLAQTVEQYLSKETPLWWVDVLDDEKQKTEYRRHENYISPSSLNSSPDSKKPPTPIACLWVGNAVDQVQGDRYAHIFLLYVKPEHRRRGVGRALMRYVENWALSRGDRQIGLQVFQSNTTALNLYHQLGYQNQSLWMVKQLTSER